MKLKDLPEHIQEQAFLFTNKIVRNLEGEPVELLDLLDKTYAAGAGNYMTKAANLYQGLMGLRHSLVRTDYFMASPNILVVLNLVDQCLIENKPEII